MTYHPKRPTGPGLVLQALIGANDFMTVPQLMQATGLDRHHVQVALAHLRYHRAADFMEAAAALWWYQTAADDTRNWAVEERAEELKPRRNRGRMTTADQARVIVDQQR